MREYGVVLMVDFREEVIEIICEKSVTGQIQSEENLLIEDLGYDSLSIVDMIVALEDNLGISFDIASLDPDAIKRVKDILALVMKHA